MKVCTRVFAVIIVTLAVIACAPNPSPVGSPGSALPTAVPVSLGTPTGAPSTVASATTTPSGGTLVQGFLGDPKTLNSIYTSDVDSDYLVTLMGNSLLRTRKDLAPECDLCESFTVSPDNLKLTFKLRQGVKFHDGTELTADDVKFTYDSILDPDKASVRLSSLKDYLTPDSIRVIDPYTIEFTFSKVKADTLVSDFRYAILPKHILGELQGKAFLEAEFNTQKPVYTGPFKFKEWAKGDHVTLEANPDYFRGRPKLDTFIYKVVPDSTALLAQLKTGDIDIAGVDPTTAAEVQKDPSYNTEVYTSLCFRYLDFQLDPAKSELFEDKQVRQALAYGLDRKGIIDSIFLGYAGEANSIIPPSSWAYNPNNQPAYNYDTEKAKRMLDAAGWQVDADGVREKDGKKLAFNIYVTSVNKPVVSTAEAIQQMWKEIGVDAQVVQEELQAFIQRIGNVPGATHDFDTFISGICWFPDPDEKSMWHTSGQNGGFNAGKYSNPEMDKLIDEALATLDQTKRKDLYYKIQAIAAEDVPLLPLYYIENIVAYPKRLQGYTPGVAGVLNNVHEWTLAAQ